VVSGLSDYFPALNTGDFGFFGRGRGVDRRILRENGLFVVGILPELRLSFNCGMGLGDWGLGIGDLWAQWSSMWLISEIYNYV
jgi:hypothetical protein